MLAFQADEGPSAKARGISAMMLRPIKAPRLGSRTPTSAHRANELEKAILKSRVDEIGATLAVPLSRTPASERMAALKRRIGLRQNGGRS